MRTENVSNDTLKSTPIKSSFQNIGLENQLFNVGSGGQSFDQILSDQAGSKALSSNFQARDNVDAASKKAESHAQSGKSLPADHRQQRADAQQEKAALRDKRQASAEEQARAAAATERKDAAADKKAAQVDATQESGDIAAGKAERSAENETDGETVTAESAAPAEVKSANEGGVSSEIIDTDITSVEVAVDAEAVEASASNEAATKEQSTETELASEPDVAAKNADAVNAAAPEKKENSIVADAAALIDEVLASVPINGQAGEFEAAADEALIQEDASNLNSPSGAAVAAMALQSGATNPVTAELAENEAATTTATVSAEKSSQLVNNLALNQGKGVDRSESVDVAVADALEAESDSLNGGAEKLTDALDPLKSDTAKGNKSTVSNEQITTPVQERLAALAKSLEKPAKEGQVSQQRKTTDAIEGLKGNSLQRNVDQFSRLQANAAKPLTTTITTPMNQKEWAGEMGQRLMMMVSSKIQSAQIQVTPGDMGPIDVKVSMQKEQAHVVFTSHVPQTREALEQALPKLREMMDQNGVAMGNVDVRDQGTHQSSQRHGQEQQQRNGNGHDNSVATTDASTETVVIQQLGVVDFYA